MANLILKNLYKIYPDNVTAVKDLSLEIKDKEFLVLVGPSGCGKTTTLRMIAGLEEISSGEIYIEDRLVNDVAPKERDIAMVFQNYALYPHLTVYDNIAFGLKLRKIPKDEIKKNVQEVARILALEDLLDRKPKELSGGQKQRVALGRAMVRKPKVFLMDEPLSNLDAQLRTQMRIEIAKLHKNLETTFVYVTHDQTEAMTMGTRIVVMKDGLIQQIDNPQRIYDRPVNRFVAGFIGSPKMNFLEALIIEQNGRIFAKVADSLLLVSIARGQELKDKGYLGKEVILGIRAEHLYGKGDLLARHPECILSGRLEFTELRGSETYQYVKIAEIEVVVRVDSELQVETGQKVKVGFNMSKIHFFDKESGVNIAERGHTC
ncbi:ABC transporter ATP-binding protein [Desulforamulus aquiferis]|uniref:Sn-glycerol-3-phosphate ABC transporter ATP-binding protein UgpC n=1 Tax=Desulforamulus aquiferis TaxID=1397668 RepID=A0AAW7Z7R4_9FIRM|nr:sn-glycerol-3-phosphate ABC transporter ATP-binding protein UgpC [Desulforamulus aquiferis]MDO7785897.1 sn-glycerol-3-phosphate ABC transporter ATP-binding protein UgpC [Desulforamulus aquiferis]